MLRFEAKSQRSIAATILSSTSSRVGQSMVQASAPPLAMWDSTPAAL